MDSFDQKPQSSRGPQPSSDDSEAAEAQGVEEVAREAPGLTEERAQELDSLTLADVDGGSDALLEGTSLSKNFKLSEFHCCRGHCPAGHVPGQAVPGLHALVTEVLQPMRDVFGLARVNSAFRNEAHNRHVGGASRSRHRYDLFPQEPAADVSFASGTVQKWASEARRLLGDHRGGIGTYRWGIHVDRGPKRDWSA